MTLRQVVTLGLALVALIAAAVLIARSYPAPREANGRILNVAAGSPATVNQVARSIGDILGKQPRIDYLPPRAGDIRDSWARIDTAREVLGFEPRVQLDEGLARTVQALVG